MKQNGVMIPNTTGIHVGRAALLFMISVLWLAFVPMIVDYMLSKAEVKTIRIMPTHKLYLSFSLKRKKSTIA